MFKIPFKKSTWSFKALVIVSVITGLSLFFTFLTAGYFEDTIGKNWEQISSEKTNVIKDDCVKLFSEFRNETSQFSSDIINNKKILSPFIAQNTKKAYESLLELNNISDYNIEVYNSRLELFLFLGRQLNPDVLELQKALSGEKFSVVKEIGFYTYIVVFEPYKNDTEGAQEYEGVLVTAKLFDIQYKIKNKFFRNFGITSEIFDKHKLNVKFDFKPYTGYARTLDSSLYEPSEHFELTDIKGNIIGHVYIPRPDKASYIDNVKDDFTILIDIELFFLNILLIIMIGMQLKNVKSPVVKGAVITIVFIASRYFWLILEFPSRLFVDTNIDIFSPSHYASGVAFGIAKSIGELLITSIIILVLCSYIITLIVNSFKKNNGNKNKFYLFSVIFGNIIVFFTSLQIYGVIIQGLVFDSNLKYFDRMQIISTDQLELLTVQFSILLLSVSLIMILLSCTLLISKFTFKFLPEQKFFRRYIVVFIGGIIAILSIFIELMPSTEFSLKLSLRLIIIALTCFFAFYVYRQLIIKRNYTFNSILNYSILILVCVIFVPIVLLNKITSQENKYLELVAKSISDRADEKINILLSTSLEDIADNPNLEFEITSKNKYPKLAFNIWSETKLDQEDLNTAVFVLDTAKRLISDFNINPAELNTDSVISFAVRNIKKNKTGSLAETDEDSEEELIISDDESVDISSFETVLRNKEMKFYCGIKPIERIDLKNSQFNKVLGYIIIAAQYDAKNFLSQSSMQIFKSFTRDNLINKLTSQPVISEFTDGELAGSSNRDVSKTFVKSLDLFRESVRDKIDKSALRYDDVEGQLYKSFYVLINQGGLRSNTNHEKIYVVSLKLNDFGLITFFIFKYLLFVVVIYIMFFSVYTGYKTTVLLIKRPRRKLFKFGFREKIFASFFLVSVIPIVVLAIYSRAYVNSKNNDFYKSQMISDLRLVEQYINKTIQPQDYSNMGTSVFTDKSSGFSKVFGKGFTESHKNFNLYIKIKLESTTDEQLYKSDLLDTRISGRAFYNMALLKKDFFTETIDIGALSVIVGYKPLYDNLNNLIGIVSSQTVFRQNEINQELTESLVYIFGAYFVAVIFLIIIVNLLSYRISNPIIKLQKATDQISRGNTEIHVKSTSRDEIGGLVNSFNRMTKELKRSRDELKKAERESAWRDIARQVAHEIKNPLTPMKLAMQHLNHAYNMGTDNFKSILQTTNKLIIDQIETLNKIATEFSDFAKMPSRNYRRLNIDDIIKDVVTLMNTVGKISLLTDSNNSNHFVYGDKDEVQRALINILRNSLQAIDEKICEHNNGSVIIESRLNDGFYSVFIKDNGIGMDEQTLQQLFEPYFSTKSTGMGLGLVITKKIIDDMKAKIYVKSDINKGTEVEIRFLLMK